MSDVTVKNEQQNLIDDLKAPIKSFRIFALEEVIKSGASPELLTVLEEISKFEDDGECQMLIRHAIDAVKSKIAGASPSLAVGINEQQGFLSVWNSADETSKMRILSDLPLRLPKGLKSLGPELIAAEPSPVIASRVIRLFCRSWPEEKFGQIASFLNSESLSLKLAALKTIVHMKPELLIDELPRLLNSEDPQIKALAIRGLAKIDKEEALNHLQALLLSAELSDRLAGIQNCPFLPFDMVKPLLLKYFAAENHPELLIRAGWILEMNPDVQVPFKLYEIAERSPARKAELVKEILNGAVKLLEKSGILGDQFQLYTQKLQTWVHKRNALRFTKQVAAKLSNTVIDPELDQTIRTSLKRPEIQEAFNEALAWPISETAKSRFSVYLKSAPKQEAAEVFAYNQPAKQPPTKVAAAHEVPLQQAASAATVALTGKTDNEKIEIFANLNADSFNSYQSQLFQLISARGESTSVRTAAIHTMTRLKQKGVEEAAVKLIANADIDLATAAVEYLGEIDPDSIFPYLGQCLKVPDIRMKSAALGILKNFDFNQAVSSLNAMLLSMDPAQQRMALECMDQFDFALIREQLTDYLCRCDNDNLIEAGLCHFAANPSSDNVYSLYKIEKAHGGAVSDKIKTLRENCSDGQSEPETTNRTAAQKTDLATEESLKERWQKEEDKKKTRKPAYAYRSPAAEVKLTPRQSIVALVEFAKEFLSSKSSWITVGILLAAAAGFYVFFIPRGSAPENTAGRPIIVDQYVREGIVKKISGAMVEFVSKEGETFVLTPAREGYRAPRIGTKLRVSLVPFRKGPNNTYLARIRTMRQINDYSSENGGEK
ncbi:MAG: HEAT repeat domain-containing protein [Candidatus Riflebacteria bacterium]|nr:HEAT repeat domain-containing protein [Candidatus Riflebacteria bacterium]